MTWYSFGGSSGQTSQDHKEKKNPFLCPPFSGVEGVQEGGGLLAHLDTKKSSAPHRGLECAVGCKLRQGKALSFLIRIATCLFFLILPAYTVPIEGCHRQRTRASCAGTATPPLPSCRLSARSWFQYREEEGAHQVCFVIWAPELRDGVSSLVIQYRWHPKG